MAQWHSIGEELYILAQGVLALILGGALGWERELAGKWAGLRTHMLVCLAAMLFVKVGQFVILDAQALLRADTLRTDPVRIIEAIVTGVAFLGAGTVFRDPDLPKARGLTTAASLLVVAPIGVAVAIERYVLAFGATLLALFVLRVMRRFEIALDDPRGKQQDD
jgi:putative Mg2+ transporter-C (MgtC) family protein